MLNQFFFYPCLKPLVFYCLVFSKTLLYCELTYLVLFIHYLLKKNHYLAIDSSIVKKVAKLAKIKIKDF